MRSKRRLGCARINILEHERLKRKREFYGEVEEEEIELKRSGTEPEVAGNYGLFDDLPDDLLVLILGKLTSSAERPSDFFNSLLTCKRLRGLGFHKSVLFSASPKCFLAKAKDWSESAHQFLKQCVNAGNQEACYTLGMIRFYCLQNRRSGASLMARAAINSHTQALYSLAVIHFNGSGVSKNDQDLQAAVALCGRAAFLGHIDALRELGHCYRDGYGIRRNVGHGRRFLVQANARELFSFVLSATHSSRPSCVSGPDLPLLSDSGCNVPTSEPHPANRFLVDWFAVRGGPPGDSLKLCSHEMCGRPETRRHEFRRCSVCSAANYCSRACQTLDWKLRHKFECAPLDQLPDHDRDHDHDNGDGAVIEAFDDEAID